MPTNVTNEVEMISYLFRTIPDNQAGGSLEDLKIRITLPSLAGTGADLGN